MKWFKHFVIIGFETREDRDKYFNGHSYKRIKGINGITTDKNYLKTPEKHYCDEYFEEVDGRWVCTFCGNQ